MHLGTSRSRPTSAFRDLITGEAFGGIILMLAAVLALLMANSAFAPYYFQALHVEIAGLTLSIGSTTD